MSPSELRPGLNLADAMSLRDLWQDVPQPHTVITSPPYLDMHDYGNDSPLGCRGQHLEDYLKLATKLFSDCHAISLPDATFWLVAGSVRRQGRLIQLPALLANRAESAGWILRENITWHKRKALPWVHHGELRDVIEQVFLFSKTSTFHFDPRDIRSPIPNSVWWRRYPERYSPDGRLPTNLWDIDIPTQGSWTGTRSHQCPFPPELTYRMLSLTSVPGDIVLDPLAGVGTVPAMANAMGRIGYGLELTPSFVELYGTTYRSSTEFVTNLASDTHRRDQFKQTILGLRLLKFGKILGRELGRQGTEIAWIRVSNGGQTPNERHKRIRAEVEIVIEGQHDHSDTLQSALQIIRARPLSKFGIEASLMTKEATQANRHGYWYAASAFWNPPRTSFPTTAGPHLVSDFALDPDLIDDTPYI